MHFAERRGPVPIAHRGGLEEGPENTMEAFEAARRLGFEVMETDIHATRDQQLVAFHDDDLERVAGRPGRIQELTWAEISTITLPKGRKIPRLDTLLTAWPDLSFNIDPKSDAAAWLLPETLAKTEFPLSRLCIGSFSDKRIQRLRGKLGPELRASLGPQGVARFLLRTLHLPIAPKTRYSCLQVPVRYNGIPVVTPRLMRYANRLNKRVHVWTVNDPVEMHRLLDMGVAGLITDYPSVLKSVLIQRGDWQAS